MRRYEKYKDSGIEWIGEIPEHWESIRLKYIGYLYGGLAGKSANDFNQESNFNNKPFIPFTNICNNKIIDPNQLQQVVIEENEQQNQVARGDLFFMMSSENFDDVGKSSILLDDLGETYLNSFCKGFRFTKDTYYPAFINYQLLSKAYRSLVLTEANGYTRINLKIDKINDIPLKTPPTLEEQIAIANYLDKKTAEIDELIKQKEELLLLFEEEKKAVINNAVTKGINPKVRLKDSEIDWLGEIPEHWKIKRIKHLSTIISKGTTPSTIGKEIQLSGKIRFIKAENIVDNEVVSEPENYIDDITNDLLKRSQLVENDILFVIAGATLGKVAILNNKFLPANTNQAISFIRLKDINEVKFVWYYLQSSIITRIIWLNAVQSAQPNLSMENLGNFYLPFPESDELPIIVNYIENECNNINSKARITKKLIEQLKEYKTALISEVATGKVKVI